MASLFFEPGNQIQKCTQAFDLHRPHHLYRTSCLAAREIELLKSAAGSDDELFLTSTAPASLEVYRSNEYYASEEDFLVALAEALREEYKAIVDAGIILQVDDAWLPALWDRIGIGMGLAAFHRRCAVRVEALNHALRGIPEDRVRYHFCWGSWHGPHAYDLELKHLVDILLSVKAQAYLIEGSQRAARTRICGLGNGQTARRQNPDPRRDYPFHRRGGASRAGVPAHPAVCRRCSAKRT